MMKTVKKKIRIIVNPKSGIGKQKNIKQYIADHIDDQKFDFEIFFTSAKNHAITLSSEAANLGYDAVVIVGGDGTINEAAQGLVNSNTALGIIPAGSGNGLAHFLKIPLNVSKAIKKINRFRISVIDTALVNNRIMVSIAGVGFDSYVAERFSQSKMRGFWSYAKISFLEYIRFNPKRYKIYANGMVYKRSAFMVSIANSNQFGFNAQIAPTAEIDDGYLDLCIARKPRIYYVVFLIPFFFLGWLHKTPFLKIVKTKEVKIIQLKNLIAHIDGDEINLGREINAKIIPASLKIIK